MLLMRINHKEDLFSSFGLISVEEYNRAGVLDLLRTKYSHIIGTWYSLEAKAITPRVLPELNPILKLIMCVAMDIDSGEVESIEVAS